MNRRDLFKKLAAVPVAVAVMPLAVGSDDGVALYSMAHPEIAGPSPELELSDSSLETIELEFPEHEWHVDRAVCLHCGVTEQYVEDNPPELVCWTRVAKERTQALVDSFNQTWAEAADKAGVW